MSVIGGGPSVRSCGPAQAEPPAASRIRSLLKSMPAMDRVARVALPANWCWYPSQFSSAMLRGAPLRRSRASSVAARCDPRAEVHRPPVLGGGVERGWHRDRAEEREERAHLLVHDHRMPSGSAGRGEDHGFGDEQVVVDQVGEGLEQAADPCLVHRRAGDDRVGLGDPLVSLLGPSGAGSPRRWTGRCPQRWGRDRSRSG